MIAWFGDDLFQVNKDVQEVSCEIMNLCCVTS